MATYKYLDKTGLTQVWEKIKNYIDTAIGSVQNTPEIYVGSETPSGYTLYIDPDGSLQSGEGVEF